MTADNLLYGWGAALVVALVLGASWHLDGPDDIQAARDVAASLRDQRAAAASDARQRAATAELCRRANANSEARWTIDGYVVCAIRAALAGQS